MFVKRWAVGSECCSNHIPAVSKSCHAVQHIVSSCDTPSNICYKQAYVICTHTRIQNWPSRASCLVAAQPLRSEQSGHRHRLQVNPGGKVLPLFTQTPISHVYPSPTAFRSGGFACMLPPGYWLRQPPACPTCISSKGKHCTHPLRAPCHAPVMQAYVCCG